MSSIPPFMAELPLKAPEAGVFRLFPGQVLRGIVGQVGEGQVTLDFGYATLSASTKGLDLQPGQRVLVQVGLVGRDQLTLQLLPDPGTAPSVPSPTPHAILQSLGMPVDDPLVALAQRLQAQPGLRGVAPPVLAALVLAFGADAPTVAPQVAAMLRNTGPRGGNAPTADQLRASASGVDALIEELGQLLRGGPAGSAEEIASLAGHGARIPSNPQAALAFALSALAGHQVRVHLAQGDGVTLLVEEQPRPATDEPATYRFLGAVDLPTLGRVGVQCLYAPAACIARITAAASAIGSLRPVVEEAQSTLQRRLGRPMALSLVPGMGADPLAVWLAEQPWDRRGLAVSREGGWVDRRV
ncbi:MAG TPA: hypothetical protein VEI97_17725 [bacterium]|nr:hypothetical protein [bacterium]